MATSVRVSPRRLLVGLAPLAVALAALPLLAPTCGGTGEGTKTFSRFSLVIPMDRCYQSTLDQRVVVAGTPAPAGCPQAMDAGDVVKAYGLVYQLIRNDVAVYWVINGTKTAFDAEDFNIQFNGGAPATLYDWANGGVGTVLPTTQNVIRYRGGPFVVDGSDFTKASAILQQYKATFSAVNVHVSNVAFQAFVKKTMAGGWSAGGAVAPKLALLDIGSGELTQISPPRISDPKNAEPVISGYLAKAGIGSGAAAGTAAGPHGQIYDKLGIDDFQPAVGSTDWRTSAFGQLGYQILWVPHWLAPGSCSNYSSPTNCQNTLYDTISPGKTDQVLKTIGAFVAAGGDLFAECAGLGSFEGAFSSGSNTVYNTRYGDAEPTTKFQSLVGMRINEVGVGTPAVVPPGNFGSPLMQLGDFPFVALDGAIKSYRPSDAPTGGYQPGVTRLFGATGANTSWDYFTLRPAGTPRGTIVYLSGHSYSGVQGDFQIGGTRLVLNTLFNLGAGCTASGVACDTGLLGVCSQGRLICQNGQPFCSQLNTPSPELCNGLDDNCNGLVDEGLETECYDGPSATLDVGLCRAGIRQCVQNPDGSHGFTACLQQVLPAEEVCNALDDNCDGEVDEDLQQACYDGPEPSRDPVTHEPRGACKAGSRTCTEGNWGACVGQTLPQAETCNEIGGFHIDEDCDGNIDEGCTCTSGQTRPCYEGPAGTAGVGLCTAGISTCGASGWGPCGAPQVLPAEEICNNSVDENCNGNLDDGPPSCTSCVDGQKLACYTGPAGTLGVGICKVGEQTCQNGTFGACLKSVTPLPAELCNGKDDDCDGTVDDGAVCPGGFGCEHGVCVPTSCGTEQPCPEGYACQAGQGCKLENNGCGGATCPDGQACRFGSCADPCQGVTCGEGAICASGSCVGGSCYFTGCPSGQLCLAGSCQTDPCSAVNCPSGTFCRQGDCVQACTFVTCKVGEKCSIDGFCEPDRCAGKTCPPVGNTSQICLDGQCLEDVCAGLGCGVGQVCQDRVCIDDLCAGVHCPVGACVRGQCFSSGNPGGVGNQSPGTSDVGGCGCGAGGVGPVGALLALLAVPLARRRRRGRGAALVVAMAVLATATACKKDEPFDPSRCETACEGVKYCVDLATDASNCGACAQTCGEGNQCVDGACGPTTSVAPRITLLTPGSAQNGGNDLVSVVVNGERFTPPGPGGDPPGAQLRAVTSRGVLLLAPEPGATAARLEVKVDLEDEPENTWQLRVVNPDRVISNSVALDVYLPSPIIATVTPGQALAGRETVLTVTGNGLGANSQCFVSPSTGNAFALPTVTADPPTSPPSLKCTLDATAISPGSFQLRVKNFRPPASPLESGTLPLQIVSAVPAITSVSPSIGQGGSVIAITITGSGFDPSSVVLFDGSPQGTAYIDATQLFVGQIALPICGGTTCDHAIVVRNGGTQDSNAFTLKAGAATPLVAGLSPGTAYQGEVALVTFSGSGFPPGSVVQAGEPPLFAFAALPSSMVGSTEVRGTLDLTGKAEGQWLLRLLYPDTSTSSTFTFRVLSNQAILRDAAPRGGAQGEVKSVLLTASNLRPPLGGVRVLFDGQTLVPTGTTATTVTVSLNLAGKNTGGYSLQIVNPNGATPSNALSFNVTPGPPTLSSVAPSSAVRSATRTTVTLTGVNFAKPDSGGTGGSAVHISAVDLGIPDYAVPTADTTVVSATQITVQLDTLSGVPGRYDVAVWNPGGPTPPQKSNVLNDAFEILP